MAALSSPCVLLPARAAPQQQQRSSSGRQAFVSAFLGGQQQRFAGQRAALEASSSSGAAQRRVVTMASKGEGERGQCAWLVVAGRRAGRPCMLLASERPSATPPPAVTGMIKLALPAGKANPAPPVGPALGAKARCCRCRGPAAAPRSWQQRHKQSVVSVSMAGPRAAPNACPLRQHTSRHARGCTGSPPAGLTSLAAPPPPRPPVLLQGVNIMQFCKEYNAATQDKVGMIIPVEISVYEDRSFTFVLKTPPASGACRASHAACSRVSLETPAGSPRWECRFGLPRFPSWDCRPCAGRASRRRRLWLACRPETAASLGAPGGGKQPCRRGPAAQRAALRASSLTGMPCQLPLLLTSPRPRPVLLAVLLKKAAGVESGSGEPNRKMVGKVTMDQVRRETKQSVVHAVLTFLTLYLGIHACTSLQQRCSSTKAESGPGAHRCCMHRSFVHMCNRACTHAVDSAAAARTYGRGPGPCEAAAPCDDAVHLLGCTHSTPCHAGHTCATLPPFTLPLLVTLCSLPYLHSDCSNVLDAPLPWLPPAGA